MFCFINLSACKLLQEWVSEWSFNRFSVQLRPTLRSFLRWRFTEPGNSWSVTHPSTNRGGHCLTLVNEPWSYWRSPLCISQMVTNCKIIATKLLKVVSRKLYCTKSAPECTKMSICIQQFLGWYLLNPHFRGDVRVKVEGKLRQWSWGIDAPGHCKNGQQQTAGLSRDIIV